MDEKRELKRAFANIASLLSACAIMMWGVINLVHNFLFWTSNGWEETSSWWVTVSLAFLTGVLPFVVGIWMLIKNQPVNGGG